MTKTFMTAAFATLALAACDRPQGVGFGPESYASNPGGGPQAASVEFEMAGLEPFPNYKFTTNGANSPADALTAGGGSTLRSADRNLSVVVESRTYLMRQVTLDDKVYVVAEGSGPVATLPTVIRARSGCLVDSNPLRSGDATIYTLNCR